MQSKHEEITLNQTDDSATSVEPIMSDYSKNRTLFLQHYDEDIFNENLG